MTTNSPRDRQQYALQTIFSFFLGLMVLAFIGIGVNTFYLQPDPADNTELQQLYREQERVFQKDPGSERISAESQAERDRIQKEIDTLNKQAVAEMRIWARNTSIVLILFATLVMGISLIRSEQLRVISNGLLLGGLFTMIYGVGWIIFGGESLARFGVIVFALAITLALGYLRFVRGKALETPATASAGGVAISASVEDGALATLIARLDALEARAAAAAAALSAGRDDRLE